MAKQQLYNEKPGTVEVGRRVSMRLDAKGFRCPMQIKVLDKAVRVVELLAKSNRGSGLRT
jgi:hypothetical protein